MKILLVTVGYPPSLTSTARLFSELAEDLQRAGHEVTVLAPIPDRYLAEDEDVEFRGWIHEEEIGGTRVIRVRKIPVPQNLPVGRVVERFGIGFGFWLAGRRLPPHDAIISYSPPLPMVRAAQQLGVLWDAPVVVNVQDLYPQTVIDLDLLTSRPLIYAAERLERKVYEDASLLTVHSEGNREFLLREKGLRPEKVRVVPNWVDLDGFGPGPRANNWRKRHGIAEEEFVVSFGGAMGFAQGLEDIIEAASQLRGRDDIVFLMVGDGSFRKELQEQASDTGSGNVRFIDPQPPGAYAALLQASDVCLIPLNPKLATPVVPGKLQSIMAAGRPAIQISNPASDGRRIIERADCGHFVRGGDLDGLTEAIEHLHDNPGVAEAMGKRARAYAEEHFERQRCTTLYLDLIEELTT